MPLLQGPARVVLVSTGVLEAVILVQEEELIVLVLVDRVIREETEDRVILAEDRSLSDHPKVKFVFTFRKANVLRVLVASINIRSLVVHHSVLLLVLLGILRKARILEVLLGSQHVITSLRRKHVLLVIGVSLIMLTLRRLVYLLNKHSEHVQVTLGHLTVPLQDRIFRRGGP